MPRSLQDQINAIRRAVERWREDMEDRAKELESDIAELAKTVKSSERPKPDEGNEDDD